MKTTVVDGRTVAIIELKSDKYQGLQAIIDVDDYPVVREYGWYPHRARDTFYAATNVGNGRGGWTTLLMHQLLTGYAMTDHIDQNKLNNRRSNLREATYSQNNANRGKCRIDTASKFKGVYRSATRLSKPWQSYIKVNRKPIYLGIYATEAEAAAAYDAAAIKYFGEFASLNFPGSGERA